MTSNESDTEGRKRRVSFADEEPYRSDSIQDCLPLDAGPRVASTATYAPNSRPQPYRRGSLIQAIRLASTLLGDGLCESKKELKLLGILPEPESEDDECPTSPSRVAYQGPCSVVVPATIIESAEYHDEDGVSPTDMGPTALAYVRPELGESSLSGSSDRNFEAERIEERTIRASFQTFTFDSPRKTFEQIHGWDRNTRQGSDSNSYPFPLPPNISREELMWSTISPSTPLFSPWETLLFREYLAHRPSQGERLLPYIVGYEVTRPKWSSLSNMHDAPEYERLSTEPGYCAENRLWEGRFPLEYKSFVRSGP